MSRSLGGRLPDRPIEMENLRGGGVELTAAEFTAALEDALGRRVDSLGAGKDSLFEIGPSPELHGQAVEPTQRRGLRGEARIVDGIAIRNFVPGSDVVPARIAGDVSGVEPGNPLAIALNGRVAATTYAYEGDHATNSPRWFRRA